MRKVMIGTPCYDGKLDVWYVNSIMNTVKMSSEYDVEIIPIWLSFDALIQRSRNDIIQLAIKMDVDDLIFIDSDIEWNAEWIFKLLNYRVDVVGGTYPKKCQDEIYVLRQLQMRRLDNTGLLQVDGLGTGFVRLSKDAIVKLWNCSESYIDPKDNLERRLICNVVVENGDLVSEDITMFNKLKKCGFTIYLDPTITCNHSGTKKYTGDFGSWYNKLLSSYKQL